MQFVAPRQRRAGTWQRPVERLAHHGDVAVTDDALVQCLVEIRRALGGAVTVKTLRGRGYILDADVSPIVERVPTAAAEPLVGPAPASRPAEGPRAMVLLGVLLSLVVVASLLALGLRLAGAAMPPGGVGWTPSQHPNSNLIVTCALWVMPFGACRVLGGRLSPAVPP